LEFDAQVIAAYGRNLRLRDANGRVLQGRPFGRKLQVVCGDQVRCTADVTHDEIHVNEILPRRSLLARSTLRGDAEPIVANISLLVTVIAPLPRPDPFIIDRYLCAASSAGIRALVVLNKAELDIADEVAAMLKIFETAGYLVLSCSAETGSNLEALAAELQEATSVVVGQSGVGKSSLITRLVPMSAISIGDLDRDAEGRHTTTSSALYDLPNGGAVIDSPGVRDFAPSISSLEARSLGFPEVDRLALGCRFIDCLHLQEPGCAIRTAVESGEMDARRYESYRRLRRLYADLKVAQGPDKRQGQDRI